MPHEKAKGEPVQTADTDTELAVSQIVRPHLFHTPEVSGLVVRVVTISPVTTETTTTKKGTKTRTLGGKPEAKWRMYLHLRDGQRECRDLSERLELTGGDCLWLSPLPSIPIHAASQSWSPEGRKQFLEGYAPNPANLFTQLRAAFARFIYFPDDEATDAIAVLVLWTMLTYTYPAWSAVPYLAVGGPLGSGKTRVFEILNRVVYRPLPSANMTAPCMFRTLNDQGGTLLLDEAERLRDRVPGTSEILSILLSGYKIGNPARRLERVGDKFKDETFDVFGPKAIAAIASLPEALESRCIRLMMFRAPKDSPVPRLRIDENPSLWTGLRDDLHAFALTHGSKFVELARRADLCDEFGGRDYELWQPLIALARIIEDAGVACVVSTIKDFAQSLIESRVDDQTPETDEVLLRTLAGLAQDEKVFETPGGKNVVLTPHDKTPGDILKMVRNLHDFMFRSWSPKGVSNALARYGIRTKKVQGRRTYRYVTLNQFRRIEERYGVDLGLGTDPTATHPKPNAKKNGQLASPGSFGHQESPSPKLEADGVGGVGAQEAGVDEGQADPQPGVGEAA